MKVPRHLINQLRPDETIVLVIREHSITKLPQFSLGVVVYFGNFFLLAWFARWGSKGLIVFILVLCITLLWFGRHWLLWRNDLVVLTEQRLIDVRQHGVWSKTVSEILWPQIRDVQYEQIGLWATVFKYGTIIITPQSGVDRITLQHVYQPQRIRDILAKHAFSTSS
ncbi:MAG: PH domain-containing protein [Candidatus Kerfeldbacteria bacterium]|nr:PH domain-containing protein [Candidatus Kerfeldbacteria bacterium]